VRLKNEKSGEEVGDPKIFEEIILEKFPNQMQITDQQYQ
jgi:hypothetical protein